MLLSICQNTFQSLVELEAVDFLRVEVRECYAEITKTSEQIQSTVRENYLSKDDLTTIQQDFQTAITQAAWRIPVLLEHSVLSERGFHDNIYTLTYFLLVL